MPIIATPTDAVRELRKYRTLHSKRFDLGNGLHRIVHKLGRVHFQDDDGSLQDIETDITVEQATGDSVADRLPFRFRVLKQGIGYAYQSRSGGRVVCRLQRVGNTQLDTSQVYTPQRVGNKLIYQDVATDLDIIFQVNRSGIQSWRRLKSANADRKWLWGIQYDEAGQAKIDPIIRGIDSTDTRPRVLNGLSVADSQPQDDGDGTFTILRQETWNGTVKSRDPQTRVLSVTSDPVYPVLIDPDVTEHISANADDGHETGSVWYASGDVFNYNFLRFGDNYTLCYPGFRFTSVAISQGASISEALLKLYITASSGAVGKIYGDDADSAASWSNATRPTTRTKTTASASVARSFGTSGGWKSITVTSIVQEIVNRAGWASGNNLALLGVTSESPQSFQCNLIDDYTRSGSNEAVLEITLAAAAGDPAFPRRARRVGNLLRM